MNEIGGGVERLKYSAFVSHGDSRDELRFLLQTEEYWYTGA